jgi:hypothetical protein
MSRFERAHRSIAHGSDLVIGLERLNTQARHLPLVRPSRDLRLPELDERPEDDPDVQEFIGNVRHVLERDDA